MRATPKTNLEPYRHRTGMMGSDASFGVVGLFDMPTPRGDYLRVMSTDGSGGQGELGQWEHVSVSRPDRCPTWEEMDYVKDIFWKDDETVLQLHVPKKDLINNHRFCLHMWRHKTMRIPLPPKVAV